MAELQTNTAMKEPSLAPSPFGELHRLHLIMGLQCNVRCTMCYQTDFSPKFNMPDVLYKEKLLEVYPHVQSVKLQGGEPTIMKNCRDAAIILRDYPNVKLTIISNGVFIDDFWHETFLHQGGCVSVSINAATQKAYDKIVIHGEWDRVIRNLERLLKNRKGNTPTVGVTSVILKENFSETHDLIELADKMGIDYIEFLADPILSFAGLPGRDEIAAELHRCKEAQSRSKVKVTGLDDFGRKFAIPIRLDSGGQAPGSEKPMCWAPFTNLVVDWDGTVRVCCNTWVSVGNLHKTSLLQIWEDQAARKFREKMENRDYLWCSPSCSDNAAPTKLSLAHKYWYEFRANPKHFTDKVYQKVQQVRGRWVKLTKKRSKPLADPSADRRVHLPVVGTPASGPPTSSNSQTNGH